jgi:anti-anti-sigma factor
LNTQAENNEERVSYQCPLCGNALRHAVSLAPFNAPCSDCGTRLWCRQRVSSEGTILEALPGQSPELWEVEKVVKHLAGQGSLGRIVFDLSHLDIVNSSLIARLVTMSREVRSSGGDFFLVGLRPVVRETFDRLRLGKVFSILDSEG